MGAFLQRRFPRLLVEELGTPNLPKFSPMQLHGASDLEQIKMSENAQFSGRMYFPTKRLHPYTEKSPQNPILRDLSMQNLL